MSEIAVNPHICPFLGLLEDPETVCAYPTAANACHRPPTPYLVSPVKQGERCLTPAHRRCPIFLGQQLPPSARGKSAGTPSRLRQATALLRRAGRPGMVAALLLLVLLPLLLWWSTTDRIAAESPESTAAANGTARAHVRTETERAPTTAPSATATAAGVVVQTTETDPTIPPAEPPETPSPPAPTASATPPPPTATGSPTPGATPTHTPPSTSTLAPGTATVVAGATGGDGTIVEHEVQAGQYLRLIARMYETTMETLRELNGLQTWSVIHPGDVLLVPVPAGWSEPTATPAANTAYPGHVVRYGEHLSGIAAEYSTTVAAIEAANGLTASTPLFPGRVLLIPLPGTDLPTTTATPTLD